MTSPGAPGRAAVPRLTVGEWVSGVGGLVLLLSLLGPWEHRPTPGPAVNETLNETLSGWRSFGVAAAALAAVALVPVVHAVRRWQGRPGVRPLAVVSSGAVAVTLVLFGMASRLGVSSRPGGGLFVGLLGAAAVAVGGALRLFLLRPPPG